jgi:hypothetical protein
MKTLIDMAREAGLYGAMTERISWESFIEAFAALVREDDAERIAILEQDNANCRKAVSDLMDDIQKRRAAMQMALEALEFADNKSGYYSYSEEITALREALNTRSSSTHSDAEYSEVVQPQGEWVDLTDGEIEAAFTGSDLLGLHQPQLKAIYAVIAKFKEKNTPPVVPQGEPVAMLEVFSGWEDRYEVEVLSGGAAKSLPDGQYKLYTTPPSAALPVPDHLPGATKKVEPPKLRRAGSFGE